MQNKTDETGTDFLIKRLHLDLDFLIFKDLRTRFSPTLDGSLSLTLQPKRICDRGSRTRIFSHFPQFFLFTDDKVSHK